MKISLLGLTLLFVTSSALADTSCYTDAFGNTSCTDLQTGQNSRTYTDAYGYSNTTPRGPQPILSPSPSRRIIVPDYQHSHTTNCFTDAYGYTSCW